MFRSKNKILCLITTLIAGLLFSVTHAGPPGEGSGGGNGSGCQPYLYQSVYNECISSGRSVAFCESKAQNISGCF